MDENIIKFEGAVYLEPNSQNFFQVREFQEIDEVFLCGEFVFGYFECQFTGATQRLSLDFLNNCIKVNAIDKIANVKYDGYDWVINEYPKEEQYEE